MSKPGKVLRNLCKKLGVRLTVKRGQKRVYKSVAVLKRQCKSKKKKVVKRKKRFGTSPQNQVMYNDDLRRIIMSYHSDENSIRESMFNFITKYNEIRELIQEKMAEPGDYIKNLKGANLEGANLRLANLYKANLYKANLQGANLKGAFLKWADLKGARLQGANLKRAFLKWADLKGADLKGVDLQEAWLQRANLKGANLQGADLQGAGYNDATRFPQGFNPEERGMVRVNNFGKKKKRKVKRKKKSKRRK